MEYLTKLINNKTFGQDDVYCLVKAALAQEIDERVLAAALAVLSYQGETVEQILGAALAVRETSVLCGCIQEDALDTCSTGGTGKNHYNISSLSAIVCASFGVKVAKHGNRSASGRVGSADLFEALGWPIDISPQTAHSILSEKGFAFFFAPLCYPAMKAVAGLRKALGIRTVFNIVGPLLNPVNANYHVLGIWDRRYVQDIAYVMKDLGRKRFIVAHSQEGWDEISVFNRTFAVVCENGNLRETVIDPSELGVPEAVVNTDPSVLVSQGLEDSREKAISFLAGNADDVLNYTVALSAAAGLYCAGAYPDMKKALAAAIERIKSGRLQRYWQDVVDYANQKRNSLI